MVNASLSWHLDILEEIFHSGLMIMKVESGAETQRQLRAVNPNREIEINVEEWRAGHHFCSYCHSLETFCRPVTSLYKYT